MLTNTVATRIVEPSDQTLLWELASRIVAGGEPAGDIVLGKGAVIAACEPVRDGETLVGVLVRLRDAGPKVHEPETKEVASSRPTFGWRSLTKGERGVADLVAEGLTNRGVATRLFLSPHTVDAHLRHIFRKLGIASRVELARMVAENA
jgi:DNA-binding CsgD family transcriptional regulator